MTPQFRKLPQPIIQQDRDREGSICSITSGLLLEDGVWRLWYSNGFCGENQNGAMRVLRAESNDGVTWRNLPCSSPPDRAFLPSIHREGKNLIAFIWRDTGEINGLFRFVSDDDGVTFAPEPDRPLFAPHWGNSLSRELAGEGRVSNDAFSILQNEDGSYSYFSAYLQPNTDARTRFPDDNLAQYLRVICRSDSRDGIEWTPTKVIIEPENSVDPFETQFYGMHVFRYKGWYLGLLHVYFLEKQTIQPEWAWSNDGWKWYRTRQPCIELGKVGSFDSRMILFGDTQIDGDQLVWIYNGANWKHNDYAKLEVKSCVGYASLPLSELDAWLDTLPAK